MKRILWIIILCFSFIIPMLLLISSESSSNYPTDYEQLSEDERIVIRFSHVVGDDTPKGKAARKFAELVKERSNGYIEVQVFSNGMLYKDGEEMSAILRGDIQLIAPATSKLTDLVPEMSVFDLPYAFYTLEEVHEFAFSDAGKKLADLLKEQNLKVVSLWDSGFKQMSNSIRPIEHYSDLRGIRMRIMPSDILAEQFYTVGAFPRRIDFNTVFHQLQKGNVDGQENTLSNITSKNFYSLQDYLTMTDHGYLGYFLLFNLNFWDGLPEDAQQILMETLEEVQQWEWDLTEKINEEKLKDLEECQCVQIHYLTEEEKLQWENKFDPVYDYYIDHYGKEFIKALPKYKNQ